MRLNAQTTLIENGFVRIPENAPWLAEYLHELTVFPNGKHDDQADSTAQFLDWFKKPYPGQGHYEWMRMEYERLQNPEKNRDRHRVLLKGTPGASVQTFSGQHVIVAWDGTLELFADDAEAFIRNGWVKLGEWIEDEPPEGEQIAEQNKPKVTYAPGSLEWETQQEQERLAHRGGGGKREKAISPGRGGAGEEIVNAHLSLGLEIIPIVHRNYDGWTIRWSLPARRPTRDHEFESDFLQRGVCLCSAFEGWGRKVPRFRATLRVNGTGEGRGWATTWVFGLFL
jgi:hypothetical protein